MINASASAVAWLGFWLAIMTGLFIPAARAVWKLSLKVELMEQEHKAFREDQIEKNKQTAEDIALLEEGAKLRQAQVDAMREAWGRMETKIDILINRSGINVPPPH